MKRFLVLSFLGMFLSFLFGLYVIIFMSHIVNSHLILMILSVLFILNGIWTFMILKDRAKSKFSHLDYLEIETIHQMLAAQSLPELEKILELFFTKCIGKQQLNLIPIINEKPFCSGFPIQKLSTAAEVSVELRRKIQITKENTFLYIYDFSNIFLALVFEIHSDQKAFLENKYFIETKLRIFSDYLRVYLLKMKAQSLQKRQNLLLDLYFEDKNQNYQKIIEDYMNLCLGENHFSLFLLSYDSQSLFLHTQSSTLVADYEDKIFQDLEKIYALFQRGSTEIDWVRFSFLQRYCENIKNDFKLKQPYLIPLELEGELRGLCICWAAQIWPDQSITENLKLVLSQYIKATSQKELNFAAKLEEKIIDQLSLGLIFFDKNQMMSYFNPQAGKLLGFELKSLTDLADFVDFLPGLDLANPLEKDSFVVELNQLILMIKIRPLNLLSKEYVLIIEDITVIRELQEQKKEYERLALVASFSAKISHEIKNPLVSIKTFTQLLERRWRDKEFRSHFKQFVLQQVDRMNLMCKALLKLGRRSSTLKVKVSLENFWDKIQFENKSPLIEFILSSEIHGIESYVNEIDILEALKHIIENALHPSIKASYVKLALTIEADRICFKITNDGLGFGHLSFDVACDPFYSSKAGHTGLGLSLAKKTMEDHSGTLKHCSREGSTEISMELPIITEAFKESEPRQLSL